MIEITNFFNSSYANFIKDLTEKQFQNFKTAKSDYDRIKLLYPHVTEIEIKPLVRGKNFKEAENCKKVGMLYFSKNRYPEALTYFNAAIIKCPENNPGN